MAPNRSEDGLERTIQQLAATADDSLTKAAAEGIPDREQVTDWVER